ncbi:MAG TPA: hypothetical protein VHC98_03555 [Candidatus Saccharimonadales bacterium]|nr:hypothetical protein [Candidatus Saccharimonadales bacterium]
MQTMSLIIPNNERMPWSRITNTSILQKGDLLKLIGIAFQANIAVLDSHNPRGELLRHMPAILQEAGVASSYLPDHHHVLVQFEGDESVLSTGLYVGQGEPDQLLFPHITHIQANNAEYGRRLQMLDAALHSGNLGLYYMSDQEQISSSPAGMVYLDEQGGLYR